MPLTREFMALLGKIMTQILSILALSTKTMRRRRMSELFHNRAFLLADFGSEKFFKKITGETNVDDALQRLDLPTKKESLMAMMKSVEVIRRVESNMELQQCPSYSTVPSLVFPADTCYRKPDTKGTSNMALSTRHFNQS
jgi:hypothetical protein